MRAPAPAALVILLAAAAPPRATSAGVAPPQATLHNEQRHLPTLDFEDDEDDEEFTVHDLAEDDEDSEGDGSLLACSFLEEEASGGSGATSVAEASSQAKLAQRFAAEICRTGNFHDIQEARLVHTS
jgi:hypothetical protein